MKKIIFIMIIVLFGCTKDKTVRINYSVMCDCHGKGLDVTYYDNIGNIIQKTIKKDIWEIEFIGKKGDYVSILGQANSVNAKIAVRVYYNGSIFKEETINGDYAVAISSGSLPD